ncbi:TPA: hypothetical protein MD708_004113 [Citrobacter freundii]|jgi:hypothetical protein|uniref:hypothetical protein n=1 Tax=Gammaproteobacteria TaxID=1236 RepID=UPI00079A9291|nr:MULTISPECIES: hypothetical protein [Gammaproteobacteria]MBN5418826.1 hypothetical protein [Serratia marcescens]HBV8384421.1 hypothetical protein [Citrobacter freundii]RQI36233.1 hypothetical protein IPC18_05705 [Pseudomonas aeruginosa]SAF37891.1 Uncharacterised protein [Enterobacter hormaechei]HDY6068317.1 hypothetical protein [Pseudomonas aeruginosa]
MPTITVACAPLALIERKRIALAFTRLLKGLGADPSHCMVFFAPLPPDCVFRAGMPLPCIDRNGQPTQFHVRVTLSVERDRLAQHDLADGLYAGLRKSYGDAFIYLQFDPIAPEQVFYSTDSALINAGTQQ